MYTVGYLRQVHAVNALIIACRLRRVQSSCSIYTTHNAAADDDDADAAATDASVMSNCPISSLHVTSLTTNDEPISNCHTVGIALMSRP